MNDLASIFSIITVISGFIAYKAISVEDLMDFIFSFTFLAIVLSSMISTAVTIKLYKTLEITVFSYLGFIIPWIVFTIGYLLIMTPVLYLDRTRYNRTYRDVFFDGLMIMTKIGVFYLTLLGLFWVGSMLFEWALR